MSYHDDLFPIGIAYGARGGPMFNTTVLELASGYEKRNINWSKVRARYNVAYGIKKPEHMDKMLDFFYARMGRAYSFPYFDWKDHKIEGQVLGYGDGVRREFAIFKRYESGGHFYDRQITKLKPDTIANVQVDGFPYTENGNDEFGYTADRFTGVITFNQAPAQDVEVMLGYCEFYVHVRFDTDFMDIQLLTFEAEAWTDIFLVEIKEDV